MGMQIIDLEIKSSFTGNSNNIHNITESCQALSIVNRGAVSLSYTVKGVTINVAPGESFSGSHRDFTSVTVTATDSYELVVYGR